MLPIVPPGLVNYVCAPVPFILGIHSSLADTVRKMPLKDVLMFDLDRAAVEFRGIRQHCPTLCTKLAVIQQMVQSQGLDVQVVGSPTIREEDGLAMSSRNAYLSSEERAIACKLYETMVQIKHRLIPIERAEKQLLDAGFDKAYS